MTEDDLTPLVHDAFVGLADVLAGLPAGAWDAASLCAGWRVRDVVAHVSNAARYAPEDYLAEVQADDGDFGATTDRLALRDGRLDRRVLLENLRADRLHRWVPPGGRPSGALTHVVIHGLDVTMPLGIEGWLGEEPRRIVLDVLTREGVHQVFGTHIEGKRLEATDLPWTCGEGRRISDTSAALIVTLAGRTLPPGRLRALR